MIAITLKSVPKALHRSIKIMQMDYEDEGIKKTLEQLYIEVIERGVAELQKEKPAK